MALKKKDHPKFNVPNFGAKSRKRVKERWRKQRGIDNKKRIKKPFMGAEPTIGYRNPEALRGVRKSGNRSVRIRDMGELGSLIRGREDRHMGIDVVFAHSVSKKTRREMLKKAEEHGIRVANAGLSK